MRVKLESPGRPSRMKQGGCRCGCGGSHFAATWRRHEPSGRPFHPKTPSVLGTPASTPKHQVFWGPRLPPQNTKCFGDPGLPAIEAAAAATNGRVLTNFVRGVGER